MGLLLMIYRHVRGFKGHLTKSHRSIFRDIECCFPMICPLCQSYPVKAWSISKTTHSSAAKTLEISWVVRIELKALPCTKGSPQVRDIELLGWYYGQIHVPVNSTCAICIDTLFYPSQKWRPTVHVHLGPRDIPFYWRNTSDVRAQIVFLLPVLRL